MKTVTAAATIAVMTLLAGGCRVGRSADLAKGNQEFAAGRFEAALERYQRAEGAAPPDPSALFGAGASLYRLKRYEEAADAFAQAAAGLIDSSDRARALHNLGNALAGVNRFEEALDAYRQALRLEDRESTRLNYLLIRSRLAGSANPGQGQGAAVGRPDDQGLFDAARQFDSPPRRHKSSGRGTQPDSDW